MHLDGQEPFPGNPCQSHAHCPWVTDNSYWVKLWENQSLGLRLHWKSISQMTVLRMAEKNVYYVLKQMLPTKRTGSWCLPCLPFSRAECIPLNLPTNFAEQPSKQR